MTIKTLEELNKEFMTDESAAARHSGSSVVQDEIPMLTREKGFTAAEPGCGKRRSLKIISGMLIGLAVLVVIFSVFTSSKYSFFTVLTSSMQTEIPKGSLILAQQTDPQALVEGDNITFMRDWRTSVTHKIDKIYENYQDSGSRGFQTKGTNNTNPDREIVIEELIIGKVVFVIPHVGAALSLLGENIYIIYAIFAVLIVLSMIVHITKNKGGIEAKGGGLP